MVVQSIFSTPCTLLPRRALPVPGPKANLLQRWTSSCLLLQPQLYNRWRQLCSLPHLLLSCGLWSSPDTLVKCSVKTKFFLFWLLTYIKRLLGSWIWSLQFVKQTDLRSISIAFKKRTDNFILRTGISWYISTEIWPDTPKYWCSNSLSGGETDQQQIFRDCTQCISTGKNQNGGAVFGYFSILKCFAL